MKKSVSRTAPIAAIGAGYLLPAIAAKLARLSASGIYRATTRMSPPRNPASPSVAWREALVWTVIAGVVGGVARLAARRSLPLLGLPAEGLDMSQEVDKIEGSSNRDAPDELAWHSTH